MGEVPPILLSAMISFMISAVLVIFHEWITHRRDHDHD